MPQMKTIQFPGSDDVYEVVDEGARESVKAQQEALGNKLDANKLPDAVDDALAKAKASGEFKGDKGDDGEAGFSPGVSVTAIAGGHRVTITDASGEKSFDVLDGKDGASGDEGGSGEDGATFYPNVSADGTLSWTNDKGLSNPASVNITGAKGDPGDPGVYIGSEAPTDDSVNVWIDPDGEPSGYEEWEFTMTDGSVIKKRVVLV